MDLVPGLVGEPAAVGVHEHVAGGEEVHRERGRELRGAEREPAETAVHMPQRRARLLGHDQPGAGVPRMADRPGRAEREVGVGQHRVGLESAAGEDHPAGYLMDDRLSAWRAARPVTDPSGLSTRRSAVVR
jgi:hypothetical protein